MPSTQPAAVGEIVLAGSRIFTDRWRDFIKIPAITVLPVTVFGLLFVASFTPDVVMDLLSNRLPPDDIEEELRTVTSGEWLNVGLAFAIFLMLTSIANAWAVGASVVLALDHRAGGQKGHSEALRESLGRLGSLLWLATIAAVLTTIGLLLCLVPGIWLAVSWIVAPVALMAEGLKARQALGRSFRLVRPRFWPVLLLALLELSFFFVLQTAAGAIPPLFMPAAVESNAFAMFFALNLAWALVGLVGVCVHAGITTELFIDLDARADAASDGTGFLPPPVPPAPPPLPPDA